MQQIAAAFGLSYSALYSHARNHVDRSARPAPARPPVAEPATGPAPARIIDGDSEKPVDALAELAESLRDHALKGDPAASREYRLCLAALEARNTGAPTVFDVRQDAEWIAIRSAILQAVEPFPGAHEAVCAALHELAADPAGRPARARESHRVPS